MELNDFLSRVSESAHKADERVKTSIELTLLQSKAISEKIDVKTAPESFKEMLDSFAVRFFDFANNGLIVSGKPFSGKTFVIEQFAYNIDRYLEKTILDAMHFVTVNDFEIAEIGTVQKLRDFSNVLKKELKADDVNLCFVTKSPDAAMFISTYLNKSKVILEADESFFVMSSQNAVSSRLWESWKVFDLSHNPLSRESLVDLLMCSIVKSLNSQFTYKLTRRQITHFVKHVLKTNPEFSFFDDGQEYIHVPAGVWATTLRHLMGNLIYVPSDRIAGRGSDYSRQIDFTMSELKEVFNPYRIKKPPYPEGVPAALIESLQSAGERALETILQETQKEDIKPITFNDLTSLEDRLKSRIFGQDKVIKSVVDGLVIPAAGLHDQNKPLRSLFFLGPTGVGKTQLAIELSKGLSDTPLPLIRINMSEYQNPHEVAKLFGSPPGYVGHEDGGMLTSKIADNPQCILLLDEVEKASPKVWDSFLQVLDAGQMTDSHGKMIDFTETIIVMTSNIGVREAVKDRAGFMPLGGNHSKQDSEAVMMRALKDSFAPEFLNRIDQIVIFDHITVEVAESIALRELSLIRDRLLTRGYDLDISDAGAIALILDQADISLYGAREIQRVVSRLVSTVAANHVIKNKDVRVLALQAKNGTIEVVANNLESAKL